MGEGKEGAASAFFGAVHVDAAWALDGKPLAESRYWLALAQHQGDDRQRLFMWDGERLGVLADEAAIELLSGDDRTALAAMLRRLKNAGGAALAMQFHIERLAELGQLQHPLGSLLPAWQALSENPDAEAEALQAHDLRKKLAANLAGLNAAAGGPAAPVSAAIAAARQHQRQTGIQSQQQNSAATRAPELTDMARGRETRTAGFDFKDGGYRLEANTGSEMVAKSLVRIAHARGWYSLRVAGDMAFRRAVWLEAAAQGMQVWGYAPTPEDIAMLHNTLVDGTEESGIGLEGRVRPDNFAFDAIIATPVGSHKGSLPSDKNQDGSDRDARGWIKLTKFF